MDDATFTRESFRATIAFGLLALGLLLLASLWYGVVSATAAVLLSAGATYLSQGLGTWATGRPALVRIAMALQLASVLLWVLGFLFLLAWRA